MTTQRTHRRTAGGIRSWLARFLVAVVTVAVAAVSAPAAAYAEDQPTVTELLNMCDSVDYCEFHPSGPPVDFRGEYQLAGGAVNCTPSNQTRVIRWESTSSTTNTVGVEISASTKLGKAFEAGVKVSYSYAWTWSSTKADELRQDVGPYSAINVYAGPMKTKVRGTYELHFPYKYRGHYYWYVDNVEVEGPANNTAWDTRTEARPASC